MTAAHTLDTWPRLACVTLDLEDGGGVLDDYLLITTCLRVFSTHGVRLTVFVVGQLLERRSQAVELLREYGAEFELHSYSHELRLSDAGVEIAKGKEAFENHFGRSPQGYRAPWFRMSGAGIAALEEEGFRYDASVLPSLRPGIFNRLSVPCHPFLVSGTSVIELPVSVLPFLRCAYGLSYMKFAGLRVYRGLSRMFGPPVPLVFYLHLQDLTFSEQLHETRSWGARRFHRRNVDQAMNILEGFLVWVDSCGFDYAFMSELYEQSEKQVRADNAAVSL